MSASQRVSRGLHRLGVFLAAVLLLVGEASALQYQRFPLDPPLVGITVTGPIVPGDFDRFSTFIGTLADSDRLSLYVDSPGGSLFEATKIAALIHKSGATVTIPSGSQCSSACFLLFAAAAHRFMAPDALVGVHSASENGEENLTSMGITTFFAREAAAYGVPPAIIGKMVQTEPGRMAWLTPSDLKPMGVVPLTPSLAQALPATPQQPLPVIPSQAVPRAQSIPPNTTFVIQVGSKASPNAALAAFADMQRKFPRLIAGYRPIVQKADLGAKGVWYRLRIGQMDDVAEARKLCRQLISQGLADCLVMKK
jgi:hypothetical protein